MFKAVWLRNVYFFQDLGPRIQDLGLGFVCSFGFGV